MKNNKFIVYSSGYNCAEYIKLHMSMINKQTYKNFIHIIVDDCSTDNTYNEINKYITSNTFIYKSTQNNGWLQNSTKFLIVNPNDIIILVDLDDWLAHDHVLERINKIYNETDCWLTYGSYLMLSRNVMLGREYPENIVKEKKFREHEWLAYHPQTFKGFLWLNLDKDYFKDIDGKYMRACYDQTILLPMLEMCPYNKIKFIKEYLYVYNDGNPLNIDRLNETYQKSCEAYTRSLPRYREYTE